MNNKTFFSVGKTDYGKWLAISAYNPYFVFEGDSQEEVEVIANRALDFYFGFSGEIKNTVDRGRSTTLSSFSPTKTVERRRA